MSRLSIRKLIQEACNYLGQERDHVCGWATPGEYSPRAAKRSLELIAAYCAEKGYTYEQIQIHLNCSSTYVIPCVLRKTQRSSDYKDFRDYLDDYEIKAPGQYKDLGIRSNTCRMSEENIDRIDSEVDRLTKLYNDMKIRMKGMHPLPREVSVMHKEVFGKLASMKPFSTKYKGKTHDYFLSRLR